MTLETIDIINGILLLLILAISIFVGIKIITKYFKNNDKVYLFAGTFWILLVCPWYAHSTAFIVALLTGKGISPELYFILGNVFIPIGIVIWLVVFTELCYKDKQKIIIGIYFVYAIAFYIFFFYALSSSSTLSLIGELQGEMEVQYSRIVVVYYLTVLLTLLISGIIFGLQSMKSENLEVKLRGKLLIVAFLSYVIGIFIDSILDHNVISLILIRILEISSVIEFYAAFIMPKWIKKLFLKQK